MKAVNETEAAFQQRLSAAEIEITELRSNLDSADRFVLHLLLICFYFIYLHMNVTSHWLLNGVHVCKYSHCAGHSSQRVEKPK